MRRLALIVIAATALASCNKTDRDNIRNAAGNAGTATVNNVRDGAAHVENFATKAGTAISSGARETYRSFNEGGRPATANESGKKTGN